MKKLNIAELLKDCPKGTKLYSPIFGDVYLEKIRPHLAIVVTTDKKQGDFKEEFLYDGRYGMNGECMLFPSKGKTTWEEFVYDNLNKSSKDMEEKDKAIAPDIKGEDYSGKRFGYKIPDGYEFDKVENNKIILKPIKPKYPKTYTECCEVLIGRKPNSNEISFDKMELCLVDLDNTQSIDFQTPQLFQLNGLFRLLICRNAYWKIYGEQMGLGKPWEPENLSKHYNFTIETKENQIICNAIVTTYKNRILSFPTQEMRDIFYKNFKNLIEQCKELL